MKKRILTAIIAFALIFAFTAPAMADDTVRVIDYADILTDSAEYALEDKLEDIYYSLRFDAVVVTVDSTEGTPGQAFADDLYDYLGYGYGSEHDGILLLWVAEDREVFISTCGYGTYAVTDTGMKYLLNAVVPYLKDNDYAKAFNVFADKTEYLVKLARDGNRMDSKTGKDDDENPLVKVFLSLFVGMVPAAIVISVMKGKMKTVHAQRSAENYTTLVNVDGGYDNFLYTDVQKVKKDRETTTHTSSSGRQHGGGSAKV